MRHILVRLLFAPAMFVSALPAHGAPTSPFFLFAPLEQPLYRERPGQIETMLPPSDESLPSAPSPRFKRQTVDYRTAEPAGTVIIDTPNTYLYFVLGNGKALRYGIGVGREGFTWSGTQAISRKAEWPDWTPPPQMLQRQPYLPRFMAGGPSNPLGARAMYLGGSIYRIHGTNQPETIGGRVSSGCIRMVNEDVIDLYGRVHVGTKVIVLPAERQASASGRRG
jgi:lipoprotein-anchoring transpeptidase ErfK/SrfK